MEKWALSNYTDQTTIDLISGLIRNAIRIHTDFAHESLAMEAMYGTERFRDSCQKVVIRLPRRYGHTSAAVDILLRHPTALLIPLSGRIDDICRDNPEIAENVITLSKAVEPGNRHPLRIIGKLAKIDCIILDSIPITQHHVDELHNRFSPKIMVFLGDTELLTQG